MCKKMALLAAACSIILCFTACGGSNTSAVPTSMESFSRSSAYDTYAEEVAVDEAAFAPATGGGEGYDASAVLEGGQTSAMENRKIIWTVNMSLETKNMDALMEEFNAQIEQAGGYIESSSISGNSNNEYNNNRRAYITVRVPSKDLDSFLEQVGTLGTVISSDKQREDITFQYTDTENRMKSLKMEQDKLYELLEKATDLESVIRLEERLTEVRFQIENYTSALNLYDNQVDYSTVYLNIREVDRVSEQVDRSLSSRISAGFSDTLYNLKIFGEDFLVFFIVNIPVFILLALGIAIAVFVIEKIRKFSYKKRQKKIQSSSVQQKKEEISVEPEKKTEE